MESNSPFEVARNDVFPIFGKINIRWFFLFIFSLQVILIFQGLDLSDEGFLSTFYRRIFSNPSSVSYNFMFWLTGIIGGTWTKITGPLGLLGIRLGGAIVNTLTSMLTYHLLRKYLNPAFLMLGLIMVVLALNNDIKVLNYNTLSSLFYLLVAIFLFSGLHNSQIIKILIGGFLAGLNVFIRTPNVLELGLVLGILYYHYLFNQSLKKTFGQISGFIMGYLIAIGIVLLAMSLLGHLSIFLGSMKLLYTMGKSQVRNPDVQGGYGLSRLIELFRSNTVQSLKYALIVSASVFCAIFFWTRLEKRSKTGKLFMEAMISIAIIYFIFLIVTHKFDHFTFLFTLNGLILITSGIMLFAKIEKEIKFLLFLGCFFMVSFPMGSSDGIYTAGRYCLWIALPLTLDYLLKIRSVNLILVSIRERNEYAARLVITEKLLLTTKKVMVFLMIFAGFYFIYYYPFFDRRNRIKMHYALRSDNLKGVYTTQGRAEVFNELLKESSKYIKENQYVLAYDNMAMFYYATNTIPALTNPLPGVYSAELFKLDLNSMQERTKVLPPVIRQKIATIGDASKWPEESFPGNYLNNERNRDRNVILDSFLLKNKYREVWANKEFMILMPENNVMALE